MVEAPRTPAEAYHTDVDVEVLVHHTKQAGEHHPVSDPREEPMLPLYRDEVQERLGRRSVLHRFSGVRSGRSAERILQYALAMCLVVPTLMLLRHQVSSVLPTAGAQLHRIR
jgi:hypothetical protein